VNNEATRRKVRAVVAQQGSAGHKQFLGRIGYFLERPHEKKNQEKLQLLYVIAFSYNSANNKFIYLRKFKRTHERMKTIRNVRSEKTCWVVVGVLILLSSFFSPRSSIPTLPQTLKTKMKYKENTCSRLRPHEKIINAFVPNIIHFVFVVAQGPTAENYSMTFIQFLSVLSALATNEPDELNIHSNVQLQGPLWNILSRHVTLRQVTLPTHWGKKRIINAAHVSDHLRLHILLKHGGVYLDSDTISVRSFAPLRDSGFTVMGKEGSPAVGLCNAVVMAAPDAPFLKRWMEAYEDAFEPTGWGEASVHLPLTLSKEFKPPELVVVEETAFFFPSWRGASQTIFRDSNAEVRPDAYVHHLWGGVTKETLPFYSDPSFIWPLSPHPTNLFEKLLRHISINTRLWNCTIDELKTLLHNN